MALVDRIQQAMVEAMRARETARLAALRSMRAAFLHEMKKDGAETLDDETAVRVLRRLEKQRKESIEAYEAAGREDRAAAERAELAVVQAYLPRLADEDETRRLVAAAIEETGAGSAGDLGRVMGAVMKAHRGRVDGTLARRVAAELLGD